MAKKEEKAIALNIMQKLCKIQTIISVPKNRNNDYGGFKYRSTEDILAVAKPLCNAQGLLLTCTDELVLIGNRYYIKATAKLIDIESREELCTEAYAREPELKRGMDDCQVTGTSSSYARKYALNGLFALDDVKDPDSNEYQEESEKLAEQAAALDAELKGYRDNLNNARNMLGITAEQMSAIIKAKTGRDNSSKLSINELNDLTMNLETYAKEILGGNK